MTDESNLSAPQPGADDKPDYIAAWHRDSQAALELVDGCRGIAYGPGTRESIDLFPVPGETAAPLLLFLHGGGWYMEEVCRDKFLFPAPAFVARGVAYGSMDYPLMPEASIDEVVDAVIRGAAWVLREAREYGVDPSRIFLCGHSAGGHLVAELFSADWTRCSPHIEQQTACAPFVGGCALSGIFRLENDWISTWNEVVRFSEDEIERRSPLYHVPRSAPPLLLTAGGDDDPEFHRQIEEYAAAWASAGLSAGVLPLPGVHHMNEVYELSRAESPLFQAILRAVAADRK